MNLFVNKKLIKNLIIILGIVTMLNGLLPNYAYAAKDTSKGINLLEPLEQFVVFLGDNVMQWLQDIFVTTEKIDQGGTYKYQFTPAIIFSGKVEAFDINFINPNQDTRTMIDEEVSGEDLNQYLDDTNDLSLDSGLYTTYANSGSYENAISEAKNNGYQESKRGNTTDTEGNWIFQKEYVVLNFEDEENKKMNVMFFIKNVAYSDSEHPTTTFASRLYTYELGSTEGVTTTTHEYKSTAGILQGTIATWYKVLRRIALVGLLSVLVYVGIRIVLSSSAQDKAKYKSMLKDWLVAICLLFTLHYIMSITITVTENISHMFDMGETDELFNELRQDIKEGSSWDVMLAEVVIYVTLVILTITFSFQYLKRVIYMAFYTLIAPLITLTYPLDKIKDGQAQAFTMWIREYVFTALIQVIHLVIYVLILGSSLSLVEDYPVYAVIVLLFMTKVENIIKKMFGFDKSETVGTLGAVATGSVIMNAIQQLQHRAPKGKKSEGGEQDNNNNNNNNNIRTASPIRDPLEALRAHMQTTTPAQTQETPEQQNQNPPTPAEQSQAERNIIQNTKTVNEQRKSARIIKGAMSVGKRYWRPVLKGAMKGAADFALGGAGAIIGAAAGISQGSLGGALTGAVAGAHVGKGIRQGVSSYVGNSISGVRDFARDARDTFNEGAYGEGYAETVKFKRTKDYKELNRAYKEKYGAELSDDKLQLMIESGITDKRGMQAILENGKDNLEDAIGYYTLAKKCPEEIYYDDNKLETYLHDLGLNNQDAKTMREKMREYKNIL